jgi:NADH dehydrogenase FAD-containing subunit
MPKKYHLHFPALREDIEADVVIIGGGFSGINTALELDVHRVTLWSCLAQVPHHSTPRGR